MSRVINQLRDLFNKRPNLPGSLLLPSTQGSMDVSQLWPLNMVMNNQDYIAVNGNNLKIISAPPVGFHDLVIHAYFAQNAAGAGKVSDLFLQNNSTNVAVGRQIIQVVNLDVLTQTALINSRFYPPGPGTGPYIVGVRPVYVPYPWQLQHLYVGGIAGENVVLRSIYIRLPDCQPFYSLWGIG
jgi:hypothetical protein